MVWGWPGAVERAAQRWLSDLHTQVAGGLAAAAALPGLQAAVDQHAAAVRDILVMGVPMSAGAVGAVLLAGYAQGLLAESGTEPAALACPDWAQADWLRVRLLAVASLAARPGGWAPRDVSRPGEPLPEAM